MKLLADGPCRKNTYHKLGFVGIMCLCGWKTDKHVSRAGASLWLECFVRWRWSAMSASKQALPAVTQLSDSDGGEECGGRLLAPVNLYTVR